VISGDLDEWRIAELADAPVDRMLVGTQLVVGSGAPTAGLVYKLVAVAREDGSTAPLEPVAKRSAGKATRGGAKVAFRRYRQDGLAEVELVASVARAQQVIDERDRVLQQQLVVAGEPEHGVLSLEAARAHHRRALGELPPAARELEDGVPALNVVDVDPPTNTLLVR
jgi:nicotinate phosphoribosyltransferase